MNSRDLSPTAADPELLGLPIPRRPWRRATLVSLSLTAAAALFLFFRLLPDARYAAMGGQPVELSALEALVPGSQLETPFVHAQGALSPEAVGYRRPLDADRFRLARLVENPRVWVELREPAGSLGEHFLPPNSFIGRLVPMSDAGLRHGWVSAALKKSGQAAPDDGDLLLIDGESPSSNRWVFALLAMLLGFAGFSAFGVKRLLTKIQPTPSDSTTK